MPICSKCTHDKPIEAFARDKRSAKGHASACKDCKNEYYRSNPEPAKQRNRLQRSKLRTRLAEWKKQGCQVCGYKRCLAAIDPHHLRDKEINIGDIAARTFSLDRLERELEKCVPLCANCHRELHAGVIKL